MLKRLTAILFIFLIAGQVSAGICGCVVDNSQPSDGMTDDEHRDHVSSVIGELMARTLGVTRYREDQRFVEDLHVR